MTHKYFLKSVTKYDNEAPNAPKSWMKDVGGKSCFIHIYVTLENEKGELITGRIIPLKMALCYDNGVEVNSDILAVSDDTSGYINERGKCLIKIRIQDVSKNHQFKMFSMKLYTNDCAIKSHLTEPVRVLSKKKVADNNCDQDGSRKQRKKYKSGNGNVNSQDKVSVPQDAVAHAKILYKSNSDILASLVKLQHFVLTSAAHQTFSVSDMNTMLTSTIMEISRKHHVDTSDSVAYFNSFESNHVAAASPTMSATGSESDGCQNSNPNAASGIAVSSYMHEQPFPMQQQPYDNGNVQNMQCIGHLSAITLGQSRYDNSITDIKNTVGTESESDLSEVMDTVDYLQQYPNNNNININNNNNSNNNNNNIQSAQVHDFADTDAMNLFPAHYNTPSWASSTSTGSNN